MKSKLGGKRIGAGRPKGEPKKAIGLRVPERHHKYLCNLIIKELKALK